jgi:hypothetical protein
VTLPETALELIGSFLTPGERGSARVARGLSIPFSRKPLGAFRVTERKILRTATRGPPFISKQNFVFFSNYLGTVQSEDLSKLLDNNDEYYIYFARELRHYLRPLMRDIWNAIPEAWKTDLQFDEFRWIMDNSDLHHLGRLKEKFYDRYIYNQTDLRELFMGRDQTQTYIRSIQLISSYDNLREYFIRADGDNGLRARSERFLDTLQLNISRENPSWDRELIRAYILKIFNVTFTVELLIERYAVH